MNERLKLWLKSILSRIGPILTTASLEDAIGDALSEVESQPLPRRQRNQQEVHDRFVEDVEGHRLRVLREDGLYRHLRFKNPESSFYWFDIITWPGMLVVHGDCGTFSFSRVEDMLTFFRTEHPLDRKHAINPDYWSQKLQPHPAEVRHKEFSPEVFKRYVAEEHKNFITWQSEDDGETEVEWADELWTEIEWNVLCAEDEHEARRLLHEFTWSTTQDGEEVAFEFTDSWEWDLTDYTFQFLWCLYAVAWGIKQYDEAKKEAAA